MNSGSRWKDLEQNTFTGILGQGQGLAEELLGSKDQGQESCPKVFWSRLPLVLLTTMT